MDVTEFNEILWQFYAKQGRHDLPWRQPEADGHFSAYKIVVSELMLQQTQVARVIVKFHEFLTSFPTVQSLATAELGDVLKVWSGLGYNRRAKFLWQTAQKVVTDMNGTFPDTIDELVSLPGIGKNTAGAVRAYAFNLPAVFIETNVRTVYIHHFFADQTDVSDAAITELVAVTVDTENPREFYWALMDYGSFLKQTVGNVSKFSKAYTKQSAFAGSRRQVRGQILKVLASTDVSADELSVQINDARVQSVVQDLLAEGLIQVTGNKLHL